MKSFNVTASLKEALSETEELMLPDAFSEEWEPMECLGHSDHCETLLLRSRKNSDKAVLKLIHTPPEDDGLADKLRALRHKGLPTVLAVCMNADRLCILREYIEGTALSDTDCRFSPDETVRIILQLCDILGYLHSLTPPLIHRDVKPENILLRPDGTVTLIDFGIARLFSETTEKDTRVMGTENFAPPEQYGFRQTDCRSDLYALGMVMGWMLTGSFRSEDFANIPSKPLRKIIGRCTAFSPEARYASAADIKKALLRLQRPGRAPLWIAACLFCLLLVGAGLFMGREHPKTVAFTEPLIERAVRQMLGVSPEDPLTAEQLAAVEGLYIFGDAVAVDQDGFYTAAGNWYASSTKAHGPITQLTDASLLPSLRFVMVAANHITDISPLSGLSSLEKIEFKHNSIQDISPLKGLAQLSSVGLNDNPMTDISPLLSLPALRFLDLCDASSYDPAVIEGLADMEFLDVSNRTDSWCHLGARRIRDLRLGWTGLDSLDALSGIIGLERLSIEHTGVTSLSCIEQHQELTYLRMSGCAADDLSPLLSLPKLETLVIDETLRSAAESLGSVPFNITYE